MIKMRLFIIAFCLIIGLNVAAAVDCSVNQKTRMGELRRHLLCDYDKSVRPILDINKPVIISLRMYVKSYSFDAEKLTIYSWFPMAWKDEHLNWEPSQWDNIKQVLVGSQEIWTPDITLYNSDNGQSIAEHNEVTCEVDSKGAMSCVLPLEFTGHCKPNYKRWPYDVQNCTLFFGSWMSPGEHIDFNNRTLGVDTSETQPNVDWKIISSKVRRISKTYSCCPNETYPTITFTFQLQRHSGVMDVLFIVPAIFMLSVNLITLLLNNDNGNNSRFTLLSLNIISHFLFLQQLTWYIPNNGDTVPDVLLFFRDSTFITLVVLLQAVLVQSLHSCQVEVPVWIDTSLKTVSANKIGNTIFFRMPYEKKADEEAQDDGTILVTPLKSEITLWKMFAKFLDRLLFLILFITYVIMFLALLPEGY